VGEKVSSLPCKVVVVDTLDVITALLFEGTRTVEKSVVVDVVVRFESVDVVVVT
jgi:hypothetical protein